MKTRLASLLVLSILSLTAVAAGHHQPDNERRQPMPAAAAMVSIPPLAARFKLHTADRDTDWFMIREPRRIATFNAGSRQGEVWTRDEQGRIEYTRVFADDRKAIDYTSGQMETLNMAPDWARLASIISPETIAQLRKTGERKMLGRRVLVLEGKVEGAPLRLWWLPQMQLPARLEWGHGNAATRLVLQEIHKQTPIDWNWTDESVLDTYAKLDATDLGDMEYDPFVQKVLRQDGHHHSHEHQGEL